MVYLAYPPNQPCPPPNRKPALHTLQCCANRGLSGKPYANPLKPLIPEGWSAASKPLRQVVFNKISGKICFLKIRKVLINNIIY